MELVATQNDLQLAEAGAGALLQRDYWAVIDACSQAPRAIMADLRRRFCEFAPPELVQFTRSRKNDAPLDVGDELEVSIRMAAECRVRLVCRSERSFTLATLSGHPEAGRITFGAYRHDSGAVIFHIRSRSRSGSVVYSAGFFAIGEAMQTNTWAEFVANVAQTYGIGVLGELHVDTQCVDATAEDGHACNPTFDARGTD